MNRDDRMPLTGDMTLLGDDCIRDRDRDRVHDVSDRSAPEGSRQPSCSASRTRHTCRRSPAPISDSFRSGSHAGTTGLSRRRRGSAATADSENGSGPVAMFASSKSSTPPIDTVSRSAVSVDIISADAPVLVMKPVDGAAAGRPPPPEGGGIPSGGSFRFATMTSVSFSGIHFTHHETVAD